MKEVFGAEESTLPETATGKTPAAIAALQDHAFSHSFGLLMFSGGIGCAAFGPGDAAGGGR